MRKLLDLVDFGMERVREFTIFDYSLLKTCLISFGALIGAYFSDSFKKFAPVVWLTFILSYATLIYRIFFAHKIFGLDDEEEDFEF